MQFYAKVREILSKQEYFSEFHMDFNFSPELTQENLLDFADTKIHCIKDLRKDYFDTVDCLTQNGIKMANYVLGGKYCFVLLHCASSHRIRTIHHPYS